MRIRCGNHDGVTIYHESAADVRKCFEGAAVTSIASEVERYHRQQASLAAGEAAVRRMTGQSYGGSKRVASEPMVKYVYGLANGKSMDEDVRVEALRRVEAHRREDEPEPMPFDFAKVFIDAYKNAAKRTEIRQAEPGAYVSPERVTQDGMYRDPATGAIFKVQWNRANGDGRQLYAKQLLVDMPCGHGPECVCGEGETRRVGLLDGAKVEGAKVRFEFVSGLIKKVKPEWRMSLDEAEKFGALYGICMRCGRELTLEESIAAAMGRVCRGKANWS